MRKKIEKHWFEIIASLILMAFVITGISVLFGYMHRTNDDVLLRSIASGNYTGTPDAHLIYMLYPLGLIFQFLYTVAGAVSWYDIFVVALHYFCWWAILIRIAVLFEGRWKKLLSMLLTVAGLLIVDLPYVVLNQYTVLAGVCAATAVLWLTLYDAEKVAGHWIHMAMIVFMMVMTLWIRKEVFYMALPLGGCILLYQWLMHWREEGFKHIWLKRHGILLGVLAVITGISFLADALAYNSPEWKEFDAYNQARTEIFDYYNLAPYELNREFYENEGIGVEEYEVINSMSLVLMPELDAVKLQRLADLAKWHKGQMEQYYSVYRKTMYAVCDVAFQNTVQPIGFVLTVVSVALLAVLMLRKRKEATIVVLIALLYEGLFTGYFIWKNRFPERVSFGLYLMLLLLFVGLLLKEKTVLSGEKECKGDFFWKIVPFAALVFVLANVGLYQYRSVSDQVKDYKQGIGQWQQVQYYVSLNPQNAYLIKANMAGLKGDVMTLTTQNEPQNTLLLGTWISESPHYHNRRNHLGLQTIGEEFPLKSNLYLLQLENDNVSWLTDYYAGRGVEKEAVVVDVIDTADGIIEVVNMQ